jgi:hypothetical protein
MRCEPLLLPGKGRERNLERTAPWGRILSSFFSYQIQTVDSNDFMGLHSVNRNYVGGLRRAHAPGCFNGSTVR